MRKTLLSITLLALATTGFIGCSKTREWNREQRKEMREALRDYRKMVYLDDLTDAEFVLFADDVAETLENSYPVYTTFVTMPGMSDTVDVVVVTTIVDELNADAHNMRHIYPYNYLRSTRRSAGRTGSRPTALVLQMFCKQGQFHVQHHDAILQCRAGRHDQ